MEGNARASGSSKFMSVQQAAQFLGVSVKSLYSWVHQRRIPFRKAGRRLLFLESELVEWTCPADRGKYSGKDLAAKY